MSHPQDTISVLWLIDHIGYKGNLHGGGSYCLKTISQFDAKRFNVLLCVLRKRDKVTSLFEKEGIRVCHLSRHKFDPLTLLDILNVIKKEKIQLLHTHGYGAANFGRIVGALAGIPSIVHAHDEDSSYPWYQNYADLLLSRLSASWLAVSEAVKQSSIKKRHCPEGRVRVMHSGIPLEKFRLPAQDQIAIEKYHLGLKSTVHIVGTVAKLTEEKGITYLLEAVPQVLQVVPETVFLIVGDGLLKAWLEAKCRRLQVDANVIFVGHREDVSRIMATFDIQVMPSLTEGFPMAILEAVAMGKPVIATNVGGVSEIVADGKNGLLVAPKDPAALAEKIIYLLTNRDVAKKLGAQAEKDSQQYDIQLHVKRLEAHYCKLLEYP